MFLKRQHRVFDLGLGYITTTETEYLSNISQLIIDPHFVDKIELLDSVRKSFKLKARKLIDSRSQQDGLDVAFYDYTMFTYQLSHYKYDNFEQLIEQVLDANNATDEMTLELLLDAKYEMDRRKNWYDMYVHFCQEIAVAQSQQEIEQAFKVFNEKVF